MRVRQLALARALVTGVAGTGAMTVAGTVHAAALGRAPGFVDDHDVLDILDYDSSAYVPLAAATLLRLPPLSSRQRRLLFHIVHWGYGSVVGSCYTPLARRLGRRRAAAVMVVGTQAMAFTLFPLLGGTPPPWRWRRDQIATSVVQHAVYTCGVACAARLLPS
jgi:hypothetical protein